MNPIKSCRSTTIALPSYLRQLSTVASQLHLLGWAPKNAGNFSIRMNDLLLTKISGAPMRRIAQNPLPYLCFVTLPTTGFHFCTIPPSAVPTSEILTHLATQRILFQHRPQEQVLLHTHPTELVKFSCLYTNPISINSKIRRKINDLNATAIRRLPSGSKELAVETALSFRIAQIVIWPGHGVIASGKSIYEAFVKIKKINSIFRKALINAK